MVLNWAAGQLEKKFAKEVYSEWQVHCLGGLGCVVGLIVGSRVVVYRFVRKEWVSYWG